MTSATGSAEPVPWQAEPTPPYWATVWHFGRKFILEDDSLDSILHTCFWGESQEQHCVSAIGDAIGVFWGRPAPMLPWIDDGRAPWQGGPYARFGMSI